MDLWMGQNVKNPSPTLSAAKATLLTTAVTPVQSAFSTAAVALNAAVEPTQVTILVPIFFAAFFVTPLILLTTLLFHANLPTELTFFPRKSTILAGLNKCTSFLNLFQFFGLSFAILPFTGVLSVALRAFFLAIFLLDLDIASS